MQVSLHKPLVLIELSRENFKAMPWKWAIFSVFLSGAGLLLLHDFSPAIPNDRPIALRVPEQGLTIALFGTSLSHKQLWPETLAKVLGERFGVSVAIKPVTQPGAGSLWALENTDRLVATDPDWVLIEFSINDADIRDGQSLDQALKTHRRLLAELQSRLPNTGLVLMSMNPAQRLRGLLRPRLAAHYRQYRSLAEEWDTGLIDLNARWLDIPSTDRGLAQDGLHPDRQTASRIIVPALSRYLILATQHNGLGKP